MEDYPLVIAAVMIIAKVWMKKHVRYRLYFAVKTVTN
jgi:hypothetical protein